MLYMLMFLFAANVLSFIWSVAHIFRKSGELLERQYRALQVFSLLTWISAFSAFWRQETSFTFLVIPGILAQLTSLTIFWTHTRIVKQNEFSLIFSKDIPSQIVQNGLYRWIRHPFYLCYLLCYFSLAVALLDVPTLICSVVMFLIYWNATLFEEGKFLTSHHSADYRAYLARTGRFLPRLSHEKGTDEPVPSIEKVS